MKGLLEFYAAHKDACNEILLALLVMSESLPFVKRLEANGVLHGLVGLIKKRLGPAVVVFLALGVSGCSTAYTSAAASLTAAEKVVQAAAEQFPKFDQQKRHAIVMTATSYEDGAAHLAEWDITANKAVLAIEGAHATVRLGADGLRGVHDGLRDPKQLSSWILPAIKVGRDLANLLEAFGLKLKGVP